MSNIVRHPGPGCIVEFMQGNQEVIAWVMEEQSGKLRVWTVNKREVKLPAARLLPWSGPAFDPAASKSEIEEKLRERQAIRQNIRSEIDVPELWEMTQSEVPSATAQWFAEMLWSEPDIDHIAAMGGALLACKTHFKFRPPQFEILEHEKVEAKLIEAEKERIRVKLATAGQEFLKNLWTRQQGPVPTLKDEETAEKLKEMLMRLIADPDDKEFAPVWRDICKGMPDHPHLALLLAEKWELVPPHYNFLIDQAGYAWGDTWWHGELEAEVRDQKEEVAARATEPEATPFVSIDAPTTRDIDDAFYLEKDGDGYRLAIALACPPFAWKFGSPLDRAVFDRASSVYLPDGVGHMMPETLGTELYSLKADGPRPGIVLDFTLDAEGHVTESSIRTAIVRMAENVSYEDAEQRMDDEPEGMMRLGWQLSHLLRENRLARNAVVIDRPEPVVTLEEGEREPKVVLEMKAPTPRAQLLVSEMMILANATAAKWAAEHDVALLYRTQDFALPSEYSGIWTEPHEIYRVVKQLGPSILEPEPKPHRSLGLKAYAPLTSPLRRYPDLINVAQIYSRLTTGEPQWTADDLVTLLPRLTVRIEAIGQVQRFRPRYWKLVYLKQNIKKMFTAVVVEDNGQLINMALPDMQIFVRVPRDIIGDKVFPGQHFQIRFGKIDPLMNEIRVVEALEE